MYKTCSRCGKLHPYNFICTKGKAYSGGQERQLRHQRKWTEKSQEIREHANHLCEVCRDNGVYTYKEISVHHITKIRDDKELLLDNYNLVCLCQEHHKEADRGNIDADYLRELARKREDG